MKKNTEEQALSDIPNDKYQKFFDKFKDIDALDIALWKQPHLLAYFSKKYQETYNIPYQWKFNTPSPTKCFEVWQINSLAAKLSSNPQILKDYIDWIYLNKVPTLKNKFRSISFITKDENVNFYKLNILLAGQNPDSIINRSTLLPSNYNSIIKNITNKDVKTYGDLAFIYKSIPLPDKMDQAFQELSTFGFDINILSKIV